MTTKNPPLFYFICFWTLAVISFLFFAGLLVLEANGYRLNRQSFKIEKTGLILLDGVPRDINITINGERKFATLPLKYAKLFPNRYEIEITKDGYYPWSKSVFIEGGQAVEYDRIYLFSRTPKVTTLDMEKYSKTKLENEFTNQSAAFQVRENEIWYRGKLVTRFSEPVLGAVLMRDSNHVIFQLGQEIRVIEKDGTNNTLLYSLKGPDKTIFAVSGSRLTLLDADSIFQLEI